MKTSFQGHRTKSFACQCLVEIQDAEADRGQRGVLGYV